MTSKALEWGRRREGDEANAAAGRGGGQRPEVRADPVVGMERTREQDVESARVRRPRAFASRKRNAGRPRRRRATPR